MGLLTFKGGIHPDDGKRFSKDSEIRTLLPKGELADGQLRNKRILAHRALNILDRHRSKNFNAG